MINSGEASIGVVVQWISPKRYKDLAKLKLIPIIELQSHLIETEIDNFRVEEEPFLLLIAAQKDKVILPTLEKLASSSFSIDDPRSDLTESEMISSLEFSNTSSTPIQIVSTFSQQDNIFVHFRYSSKIPIQMRFDLQDNGNYLQSKSIWLDETRGYFTLPLKVTQNRGYYALKVYLAGILCEQGQFVFKGT